MKKVRHKEINGKQYRIIAEMGNLEAPKERLIVLVGEASMNAIALPV